MIADDVYPRPVSGGNQPTTPPERQKTQLKFTPDAGERYARYVNEGGRVTHRLVVGWIDRGHEWADLETGNSYATDVETVPAVLDDSGRVVAAGDLPGRLVGVFAGVPGAVAA